MKNIKTISWKTALETIDSESGRRTSELYSNENKYLGNPMFPDVSRIEALIGSSISEVRPLVFSNQLVPLEVGDVPFRPLNMPFKTIWIEWLNRPLAVDKESEMLGCLISERAPCFYDIMPLMSRQNSGLDWCTFFLVPETFQKEKFLRDVYKSIHGLLSFWGSKSVSVGRSRDIDRLKIGRGVNRKLVKIKDLVVIYPKQEKEMAVDDLKLHSEVDWSHRWQVRGHWRKCSGLGKDRGGSYSSIGYTWVVPHEKGPDHLPLVKKTRFTVPMEAS